jgi:hypothetical protein
MRTVICQLVGWGSLLHRLENVSVEFRYGLFSMRKGHARLRVGSSTSTPRMSRRMSSASSLRNQESSALRLGKIGERTYWHFQNRFYWENDGLMPDEVRALLLTQQERQRGRIKRAQAMVAMGMQPQDQPRRRDLIPDDVKQFVWMRMVADAGSARHRRSFSSSKSSRSLWAAASNPENLQILCGRNMKSCMPDGGVTDSSFQSAASAGALPDDHPAAALWWRILDQPPVQMPRQEAATPTPSQRSGEQPRHRTGSDPRRILRRLPHSAGAAESRVSTDHDPAEVFRWVLCRAR